MTRKEKRYDVVGVTKAEKDRARTSDSAVEFETRRVSRAAHPANFVSQGTNSGEEGVRAGAGARGDGGRSIT